MVQALADAVTFVGKKLRPDVMDPVLVIAETVTAVVQRR